MDETPFLSASPDSREMKEVMSTFDAPAFIRRARRVQQTLDDILDRCRRQREEWLGMVRIRLATVKALAQEWEALLPLLDPSALESLRSLHDELQPRLRLPVAPDPRPKALRPALEDLASSLEFFNRRWHSYLAKIDLKELNRLREGYNRYYVVEKECVVRSPALARQGFRPLEPLTTLDLAAQMPALPRVVVV